MMRALLCICALFWMATDGLAETILMKDGRRINARTLRRQGDAIVAGDPSENGGAPMSGEVGYPLLQIEKIEFPEPVQLRSAAEMIVQGRTSDAILQLDQVLRIYEGFRDAPGSYWPDLALLKFNALRSAGRDADAESFAAQNARLATEPETLLGVRAQTAICRTIKGDAARSVEVLDQVLKDAKRSDVLASASVYKGQSHLALKQWEPALLAYLNVPVFYPEQKALVPQALLGAARAMFALEDYTRAKATLNELIGTYASVPEAAAGKAELEKIVRREKALEEAK